MEKAEKIKEEAKEKSEAKKIKVNDAKHPLLKAILATSCPPGSMAIPDTSVLGEFVCIFKAATSGLGLAKEI